MFTDDFNVRIVGMYFIVIAIGGRQDTNYNELSGIASRPVDDNIFQIERISQLETLQLDAIQSICNGEQTSTTSLMLKSCTHNNCIFTFRYAF